MLFFLLNLLKLRKVAFNQRLKSIRCRYFVRSLGYKGYICSLDDAKRKDTQETFGVYPALVLFDPNAAFKLVSLLNKEGGRSCVQTYLIVNRNSLCIQIRHDLSHIKLIYCIKKVHFRQ